MPRNKIKHRARAEAHRAEKAERRNIEHRQMLEKTGCRSLKVAKALTGPSVREVEIESGSVCLPQVAIFSAGHRKSESVTAR